MSQCIASLTEDTLVQFERNERIYVVYWFLKRLVPDLVDKIDVNIYVRKMHDDFGRCYAYKKHSRAFDIVIDTNLSYRKALRTIAHEAAHIMQYVTGKMQDLPDKRVLWKKKKVFDNTYKGKAYHEAPWEIEADALQEKLMLAYLRHVKKLQT